MTDIDGQSIWRKISDVKERINSASFLSPDSAKGFVNEITNILFPLAPGWNLDEYVPAQSPAHEIFVLAKEEAMSKRSLQSWMSRIAPSHAYGVKLDIDPSTLLLRDQEVVLHIRETMKSEKEGIRVKGTELVRLALSPDICGEAKGRLVPRGIQDDLYPILDAKSGGNDMWSLRPYPLESAPVVPKGTRVFYYGDHPGQPHGYETCITVGPFYDSRLGNVMLQLEIESIPNCVIYERGVSKPFAKESRWYYTEQDRY
jgi:hypothetical protein